jgi:DNA-binding beta-propeller fold protein YncE
MAVDPSGNLLYVANGTSDNLSVIFIGSGSGALTEVSGSPFAAGSGPRAVAID